MKNRSVRIFPELNLAHHLARRSLQKEAPRHAGALRTKLECRADYFAIIGFFGAFFEVFLAFFAISFSFYCLLLGPGAQKSPANSAHAHPYKGKPR